MTSLALKLYYLRTREKRLSQQAAADQLGIRQATLSHLERARSMPNHELLGTLCRFFDVTPTFLLDDDRGVAPRETERWSNRDALLTTGMTLEVPAERGDRLDDGSRLITLEPGDAYYDDESAALRREHDDRERAQRALARAAARSAQDEQELEDTLRAELGEHPRRRATPRTA